MSKHNAHDFFTVIRERTVGRSKSGYPIKAFQLRDRQGAAHVAYHITLGPITEIFYDIKLASGF